MAVVPVAEVPWWSCARSPGAEVPVAEVPVAEVPVAEVSVAEVSMAEVPVAESLWLRSLVEVSVVEVFLAEVPVAAVPMAAVPVAEVSLAEVPMAEVPIAEVSVAVVPMALVSWLFLQSVGGVNVTSEQNACGPTKCEVERFTATDFGHAYVPSCQRNGDFQAVQCQRGGPCWCADAQGKEVPGTRRQDAALPCAGAGSCSSERRRALSRLRFGPSGDLGLQGSFLTSWSGAGQAPPCSPAIKELFVDSGILRSLLQGQDPQLSASGSLLPEAIRGIFPSRELARLALQFTANPKRLQQNLFGGRFLVNVGQFNFVPVSMPEAIARDLGDVMGMVLSSQGCEPPLAAFLSRHARQKEATRMSSALPESAGPTPCQLRAERAFLGAVRTLVSNSSLPPALASVYVPQCSARGRWRPVQCDGPPEQAFEWYERWRARDNGGRQPTAAELLTKAGQVLRSPRGASGRAGREPDPARGNVLLEPYLFWQILGGRLRRYPGPYSDFSAPLAHLDLRTCWCVDEAGQEREGTRTKPGEVPHVLAPARTRSCVLCSSSRTRRRWSWLPTAPGSPGGECAGGRGNPAEQRGARPSPGSPPRAALAQQFLRGGSEDALRLAAQSTFDFYQRRGSSPADSSGASRRRSSPYVPQCDAFGNWEPVQCHAGTGSCWCVDGKGEYVPASLTARSSQAPQCPSACERARASGLLSSWKQAGSQGDPSPEDLFIPACLETGEFARLQATEAGIWCVDQASGEGTPPRTNSSAQCPGLCEAPQSGILSGTASPGYTPACGAQDGGRSPVQCSPAQESCWCVLGSGEEVPGTRVVGSPPACESPQCPLPFNASDVAGGVVLCEPASGPGGAAVQRCQLLCRRGYQSAFPPGPLECSVERRRWLSQPPQPRACQRPQLWQTLQTGAQFQLRLPPGKMCSADYAGLLLAFQAFVLDELTARGFCQVPVPAAFPKAGGAGAELGVLGSESLRQPEVKTLGTPVSVPVCDDSAVRVECLTQERLGVNVTWKLRLEDVPPASLPDLRDVAPRGDSRPAVSYRGSLGQGPRRALRGSDPKRRFQLHLDAKTFPADTALRFLLGDSVGPSPRTRYGCLEGFHPVSAPSSAGQDPLGCVKCPEGSHFQDERCVPCPAGFYQEQAGSVACAPCPAGRTTVSAGAFSRSHCVTDCQRNEAGLQCDRDGGYRASQRDGDSGKAFCVDAEGQRLLWSESEAPLTDSQCLMMQKFEKVPESKVVFDAEVAAEVRSQVPGSESPLAQCLAGCASDQACSFLAVSMVGPDVSCDVYAWTSDSIACTASGQEQGAAGNAQATGFGSLRCQVRVPPRDQDSVAVYLKKGQEFSTRSRKSFEQTGFQNALSGMYSPTVFAGPGPSLTEAHLFCLRACDRDACCDGFVLTQVQGGPILCGLLSSPDVLLCHVQDWRDPATAAANATCPGATSGQGSRPGTLLLGGQEFQSPTPLEGTQGTLTSFQQVYLWKDSDMGSRSESAGCRRDMGPRSTPPPETDMTSQLFSPVDLTQVSSWEPVPAQPAALAVQTPVLTSAGRPVVPFPGLWTEDPGCLRAGCVQEPSFCQLAEIRDSAPSYFTCTLYPEAQVCDDVLEPRPTGCRLILPHRPSALFRRKVVLKETVKNFYSRLPFQKLTGISIRSKVAMSNKPISNGFFECERLCDADPCCSGFGFLNVSQLTGGEVTCLTLNSLGLQTCSEESGGIWRILDCGSPNTEVRTYPFGWYQKPVAQNGAPGFCPSAALPSLPEKGKARPAESWGEVPRGGTGSQKVRDLSWFRVSAEEFGLTASSTLGGPVASTAGTGPEPRRSPD
ncbi:hypothetical protein QTO34_007555 [Cnephaeus nilssonii]|uniref:Thyroglobulin type-1 domain-containing protein n=1 Tax=Cnephaeus nilssonii TaxID=3371016 RepID=A0AA40HIJ9_CNENI|nr:hypothetical protein QTO34_007555 [Eptesicus nilssonii]